jgi:hypothetical protein
MTDMEKWNDKPVDFRTFATTFFPEKLTDDQIVFAESILKHETTGMSVTGELIFDKHSRIVQRISPQRIDMFIDMAVVRSVYRRLIFRKIIRTATMFAAITGIYLLFQ